MERVVAGGRLGDVDTDGVEVGRIEGQLGAVGEP